MVDRVKATVEAVRKFDARVIKLLDKLDGWAQDKLDELSGDDKDSESAKLATSSQVAGSPVAPCPYAKNTETPCDVETIRLTDSQSKTEVFTSLPVGRPRIPVPNPNLSNSKRKDVFDYDVVLEVVAGFRASGKLSPDMKPAKVTCEVTHYGSCPLGKHPSIRFQPSLVGPYDSDKPGHWQGAKSPTLEIYSSSQDADVSSVSKSVPMSKFESLWPFRNPVKECVFTAESCEVRRGTAKVKCSFTGLLRVYRDDKFELSISTPPLFKVAGTREAGGGKKTFETAVGNDSTKTTKERQADGRYQITEREKTTANVTNNKAFVTTTTTKETIGDKGQVSLSEPETKRELAPVVCIKHNGSELAATKVLNQFLNLAATLKKLVDDILELLKKGPKVGWSASASLSLFEGKISGEWGYRRVTALDSVEHKWVERYLDFTAAIYLFRLSLTGFGGIEVKSPEILMWAEGELLELTVGLKLEITLDVKLQGTFALKGEADPDKQQAVNAEGTFKLYGQGVACWRGHRCEVQVGVAASGKFKGAVYAGFSSGLGLTGQASHDKVVLYAFWSGPGKRKRSPDFELELIPENENWGPPVAWNIESD